MISKIILLRAIENVFVCAILPQSIMVCKITHHCDPYPQLWERAGSFALDSWRVSGHHGVGNDASVVTSFDSIEVDTFVKSLIVASVAVVTITLLLAQVATLDKSYLSNMGYLSGELMNVNSNMQLQNANGTSSSSGSGGDKHQSNSNRRGKKRGGDNQGNYHNINNNISHSDVDFSFSSHNGEAQINPFLRIAHFLFQYDLGHPSTSSVISGVSMLQVSFILFLVNLFIFYEGMGHEYMALSLAIAANVIATSETCYIGVMDFAAIRTLGREISGGS